MTFNLIKTAFSAGEVSPSIFGRTDLVPFSKGCSTLRNFFVNYRGGISSRAGTAFVGMCRQGATWLPGSSFITTEPPRDVNFQFNINQGFVLEFGDFYMRVKSNGAYVTEPAQAITGITKANPAVITYNNSTYTLGIGDWIYITGVTGMTNFNNQTWVVQTAPSSTTVTVTDLFGNTVDSSAFSAYVSGGTLSRIYNVAAPYAAIDVPWLKFVQDKDTMSLCCVNQETFTEYPTYELTRVTNTNWTFTQVNFGASISPPSSVSATAQSSTTISTWYSYVVTAVDSITGQESIASSAVNIENNDIAVNAGSNTITWTTVANAGSYNVYKATPSYSLQVPVGSLYGYMGTAFGTQLTDTNITADFSRVPPTHQDPFARGTILGVNITNGGSGLSQSTIGYTVTTSTGSGFIGIPVVVGDALSNVIIQSGGKGYINTDTITFGSRAAGTYTFTTNPINGDNIILNGVTWTFTTGAPTTAQTKIHGTVAETLTALTQDLNSSVNGSLSVATYSLSGLILSIIYDTIGTGGNAYTLAAGTYGGVVSAGTLTGGATSNATATFSVGPSSGTYPGCVNYFQQRRVYGYTIQEPDTYFFSRPGAFHNMDSSIPTTASDAFTGSPWSQQVNGIQAFVPVQTGLITLTGNGAWLLNGGSQTAITASDQNATAQAYNGCHFHIQPLVINYDVLYVQSKGSIVRDLAFNIYVNVFTGADVTVLSSHLFNFHQLQQWAYAEEPYKIVWAVRDDGTMLSLTYLKEQEVQGWGRHDTNGFYVSVCSVTEPPVDGVYVIVKRYIKTPQKWVYYAERMDNRNWQNVEDCFCVDAGLSYPMTYPNAVLTPAAAEGTNNITSINLISGGVNYTSPVATVSDPGGLGSGATFSFTLSGGVITAISVSTSGQDYAQGSTLIINDSTGSGAIAQPVITNYVTFDASSSVFSMSNVGNIIRIGNNNATTSGNDVTASGGGKAQIVTYNSGAQVIANILELITNTIPNNPDDMPAPVNPNQWSLSIPVTVVTGLNHLEGMEVAILADGSVVPNQTVVNGSITLQFAASSIKIGLPYICQVQSMYLDAPNRTGGGTTQGKRKNIQAVTVRVEASRGLQVGTNQPDQSTQPNNATVPWTDMKEFKERTALVSAGSAIPLFTGDERVLVPGEWSKPGQVACQQIYPLKADVLDFVPEFTLGDTDG